MDSQFNNQFGNQNLSPLQAKWPILPTWLVVVLLIIAYPLGVIVMWGFTLWSKKIKIIITIAPFLLIALLSFLVIFSLDQERKKAKEQSGVTQQKNITLNVQDKSRHIYTNTNIGYSISYPKNWRIAEGKYDNQRNEQQVSLFAPGYVSGKEGVSISINNNRNLNGENLDNYISNIKSYGSNVSSYDLPTVKAKQDLIINGKTARQFMFSSGDIDTFIYYDKNIFQISFEVLYGDEGISNIEDYIKIYQDIIQAFKLR